MVTLDQALSALDKSGSYRVYLCISTALTETARDIHRPTPVATAALSRALTAGALMGIMMKDEGEKVTLQFKGNGPAREILVTAYGTGKVKGYISNPDIDLPLRPDGKLPVGDAVGIGTITCIRDMGLKEPYMGRIDLVSGEIADDLTAYFFISEQMSSSVILSEKIAETGSIASSAGMIIQMLPGGDGGAIDALEELLKQPLNLAQLALDCRQEVLQQKGAVLTEKALAEETLLHMLERFFVSMPEDYRPAATGFRDIGWECDCSRQRLQEVLLSLGKDDLTSLIEEDGGAELVCQFCRTKYQFTKEELTELLREGRIKC